MTLLVILWTYLVAHKLALYFSFAVAVSELPMPSTTSSGFYKWFFGVSHVLSANLRRGVIGVKGGGPTSNGEVTQNKN
jgi:hypothetical protein